MDDKTLEEYAKRLYRAANEAPPWSPQVQAEIEKRVPGGAWAETAEDIQNLIPVAESIDMRAILRKGGRPILYVTSRTQNEIAQDRASRELREMVGGARESRNH